MAAGDASGRSLVRRNALLLGRLAEAASLAGFAVARSFADFLVLYALWALAMTLASGTAAAWLYDALDDHLDTDRYTAVRGRGRAAGAPAGPGRRRRADRARGARTRPRCIHTSRRAWRRPLRRPVLRARLRGGRPHPAHRGRRVRRLSPRRAGRRGPAGAGTTVGLYAGFTAVAAVASDRAATVERRVGTRAAVLGVPALVAVAALAPALFTPVAVPVFVLLKSGRATVEPLVSGYLNNSLDSAGRATVLSAAAMAYALVRVPLKLVAGALLVVADGPSDA